MIQGVLTGYNPQSVHMRLTPPGISSVIFEKQQDRLIGTRIDDLRVIALPHWRFIYLLRNAIAGKKSENEHHENYEYCFFHKKPPYVFSVHRFWPAPFKPTSRALQNKLIADYLDDACLNLF